MFGHAHASHGYEPHIPGVTEDTILRPLGVVLAIFGIMWATFSYAALAAGRMDLPRTAFAMILAGLAMTAIGKREQQV